MWLIILLILSSITFAQTTTPVPTATAPPGQTSTTYEIAADVDDVEITSSFAYTVPFFGGCATSASSVEIANSVVENYQPGQIGATHIEFLMQFKNVSINPLPIYAELQFWVLGIFNDSNLNVQCDYFDWGGTCGIEDYSNPPFPNNAITPVSMGTIQTKFSSEGSHYYNFPMINLDKLQPTTRIRCSLSGGLPTMDKVITNELDISDSHVPNFYKVNAKPRLVIVQSRVTPGPTVPDTLITCPSGSVSVHCNQ